VKENVYIDFSFVVAGINWHQIQMHSISKKEVIIQSIAIYHLDFISCNNILRGFLCCYSENVVSRCSMSIVKTPLLKNV
jgi:hypothetical protein